MDPILDNAISRCPFLANVASSQGSQFARSIALNPLVPAAQTCGVRRPVLEELSDYSNTFRLWHGAGGAIPLPGIATPTPAACPVARTLELQLERPPATSTAPTAATRHGSRPLPLATMSLSFGDMPDFGQLFRALQQHANQPRRPQAQQKPRQPNNSRPAPAPSSSTASTSAGGQCPLRTVLGPLAPMVFNPKGHLVCPDVIIKARAALAATKPVRELRPQSLAKKFLAVGATTALVNVPCGMAREHTEKFSFGWFVSVHASIPFIAMLRKAVIMPKYAIIYTIATAIAGQAMGAKLERKRMGRPKLVCSKGDGHMVAAAAAARPAAQLLSPSSRFSMDAPRPAVRTVRVSNAVSKHTATTARGHRTASRGASTNAPAQNAIVPHMATMAPGAMVAVHA